MAPVIAALFVQTEGVYNGLCGVDTWDEIRDARRYSGPYPVVAHPPCLRWGRFWHGGPAAPHTCRLGDDAGCFDAALAAVRTYGGVLEHPANSHAWEVYGLPRPSVVGGWTGDTRAGWSCYVEQGFYGHPARKGTWLYACRCDLPPLRWGRGEPRFWPGDVERLGRAKAVRTGIVAHLGGGGNPKKREATPPGFRDLLLSIARTATREYRELFA